MIKVEAYGECALCMYAMRSTRMKSLKVNNVARPLMGRCHGVKYGLKVLHRFKNTQKRSLEYDGLLKFLFFKKKLGSKSLILHSGPFSH